MAGRLVGKVILVTGGSSGIGRAIAQRAVAEGATVVIGARRVDVGEAVAARLREGGGHAVFVPTDATVEADAAALVAAATTEFGRLDGAVNNAGSVTASGPVHGIDAADWAAELGSNLTSVFYGLKHQVPAIRAAGGGGDREQCLDRRWRGYPGDVGVRGGQTRRPRADPVGRLGMRPRRSPS